MPRIITYINSRFNTESLSTFDKLELTLDRGGHVVVNPFTDIQFDKKVENILSMSWLLV